MRGHRVADGFILGIGLSLALLIGIRVYDARHP